MKKSNREIIVENERWFSFYIILPKITAITLAILAGITGLVLMCALYESYKWIGFVVWCGGVVVSLASYVGTKLLLAPMILQVYYLKNISEGKIGTPDPVVEIELDEELPNI